MLQPTPHLRYSAEGPGRWRGESNEPVRVVAGELSVHGQPARLTAASDSKTHSIHSLPLQKVEITGGNVSKEAGPVSILPVSAHQGCMYVISAVLPCVLPSFACVQLSMCMFRFRRPRGCNEAKSEVLRVRSKDLAARPRSRVAPPQPRLELASWQPQGSSPT